MSTKIEPGAKYKAELIRRGENEKGPWEMILVKGAGKGQRSVVLFANNTPTYLEEGGTFTVDSIQSVIVKAAKDAKGFWSKTETVINVNISAEKTARLGADSYADFNTEYDLDLDLF